MQIRYFGLEIWITHAGHSLSVTYLIGEGKQMRDTPDKYLHEPIHPPRRNRKADIGRAAAKGVLGAIPVAGSAIAEAADLLLPDPTADERDRWEGDVTNGVNALHGRLGELDRRTGKRVISLSDGAGAAARYMSQRCPDGLATEWTSLDELQAAYPDIDSTELLDGLGDLELHRLIDTRSMIGAPSRYRLTEDSYTVLDPPVMGWTPNEDAKTLAKHVLTMSGTISVRDLETAVGWPRRRFNPALRIVVSFVGDGRVSQTVQPDYITRHFAPNNVERSELRQFVADD